MLKIWRAVKVVNVLRLRKGLPHRFVAGKMRHQTKLDLAVVRGEQNVGIAFGDEGAANPPPELAAHRNVLQVGVGGREAARRRRGLVELGAQPAVFWIDELRNHVDVRVLELGHFAPFQDQRADRILARQALQHLDSGRPTGLRLFAAGNVELSEEDLAELLRRADVELFAGDGSRNVEPFGAG
jgi:hypothetical protein